MTVVEITRPTDARIIEFCHWQSAQPKFTERADWRKSADEAGFIDITDDDMPRVISTLRDMAAAEYHHANLLNAEVHGKQVVGTDEDEADEEFSVGNSERFQKMHYDGATLNDLAASMGTPEEWLDAAMIHLKVATCEQKTPKILVSEAAVGLLLYRIEQLEHGGEPWKGSPE